MKARIGEGLRGFLMAIVKKRFDQSSIHKKVKNHHLDVKKYYLDLFE
jgi:hypothetical protein